jgi:hypothetical protein
LAFHAGLNLNEILTCSLEEWLKDPGDQLFSWRLNFIFTTTEGSRGTVLLTSPTQQCSSHTARTQWLYEEKQSFTVPCFVTE